MDLPDRHTPRSTTMGPVGLLVLGPGVPRHHSIPAAGAHIRGQEQKPGYQSMQLWLCQGRLDSITHHEAAYVYRPSTSKVGVPIP